MFLQVPRQEFINDIHIIIVAQKYTIIYGYYILMCIYATL